MRSHNPYPHDVWMTQARSAVSTMLAELGDRYTRYLTPGAYASLLAKYERPADNGGIGVTVRNVAGTGAVEIVSVIEGAPAAAAGLRVGDVFETVDGRPVPVDATADDVAGLRALYLATRGPDRCLLCSSSPLRLMTAHGAGPFLVSAGCATLAG